MPCIYIKNLHRHASNCPCFKCVNMTNGQCNVLKHIVFKGSMLAHFVCDAMVAWELQRYTLLKAHPTDCGTCMECYKDGIVGIPAGSFAPKRVQHIGFVGGQNGPCDKGVYGGGS